jgi:hypothetical protein
MKKRLILVLNTVMMVLLLASPLLAEVLEPIKRINISPIKGTAGTGMARVFATHETYDYEPDPSRDIKATTLQGEISLKLLDQVGIGVIVPYHFIENENLFSGLPASGGRDENGIGNMTIGASVTLPNPSEGVDLVVGANTVFPTADEDVGRKLSALEPYAILMTRDGDLSFTASAGYQLIIDENAPQGEPESIFDDTLSLQGSAIYSANEIFSVGAQFTITSARNTAVEFVPQIKASTERIEWGIAIEIPLADDHPQVSTLEKSLGFIVDAAVKF